MALTMRDQNDKTTTQMDPFGDFQRLQTQLGRLLEGTNRLVGLESALAEMTEQRAPT